MTRIGVIGERSNGDVGVFLAPDGYDAYTAADANLIMTIHEKISALLLMGYIGSSGSVALGLGAKPIVILSSLRTVTSKTGLVRPSPLYYSAYGAPSTAHSTASVASDGSSMYVTAPVYTRYDVYNEGGI